LNFAWSILDKAKRTMNRTRSNVIMSEYVRSQRS